MSGPSPDQQAAETAARVLAGVYSPTLGARCLLPLLSAAGVAREDEDFKVMVLIESETDALPVGNERRYWAESSLRELAPQIASSERWALDTGKSAFASIAQRFGSQK